VSDQILTDLELIKKLVKRVEKLVKKMPIDPDPLEQKAVSRNEKVLRIAALEVGVKEAVGSANNARVVEYSRYASKNNKVEQPDSVPWCSSFVCWVAEKAGMGSTDSMMARSWLNWGVSSKKDPLPGDIVVYWRGNRSGWKGHVGIYLRTNRDGSIVTLGGNQSDEVNISQYSAAKLLDIRRPFKARTYDKSDRRNLETIAKAIIGGVPLASIGTDGKVT